LGPTGCGEDEKTDVFSCTHAVAFDTPACFRLLASESVCIDYLGTGVSAPLFALQVGLTIFQLPYGVRVGVSIYFGVSSVTRCVQYSKLRDSRLALNLLGHERISSLKPFSETEESSQLFYFTTVSHIVFVTMSDDVIDLDTILPKEQDDLNILPSPIGTRCQRR
jgi:hypothetical protein